MVKVPRPEAVEHHLAGGEVEGVGVNIPWLLPSP